MKSTKISAHQISTLKVFNNLRKETNIFFDYDILLLLAFFTLQINFKLAKTSKQILEYSFSHSCSPPTICLLIILFE